MSKEIQYNRLLDEMLADVDLANDIAKKKAYARCIEYAQSELEDDPQINLFLNLAAARLGQMRVHMPAIGRLVPLPDDALLHLTYSQAIGPMLTGNQSGLHYLAELFQTLARFPHESEEAPSEHIHLYAGEAPMAGDSYGLTIYYDTDDWFEKHPFDPKDGVEETNQDPSAYARREISPEDIRAIGFFPSSPLPPQLFLTHGKIYWVMDYRLYKEEEKVWAKLGDNTDLERTYVFRIEDDDGKVLEFALPIDDPDVRYFTANDLKQVLGRGGDS